MGAAKVESIGIGSKAWAGKIRKEAQELSKNLDTGYIKMGQLLWTVFNTPIDGDPKKNPIYTTWGHKTFRDYAEVELGLHHKKAERLRAIGEVLDVNLAGAPKELRERFIALGWSKARELARLFRIKADNKTVARWVEKAEQSNYPTLMHTLKKAMDHIDKTPSGYVDKGDAFADSEESVEEDVAEDEEEEEVETEEEEDSWHEKHLKAKEKAKAAPKDDEGIELPETERQHLFKFLCFDEQIDNVRDAIERAEELVKAQGNVPAHGGFSTSNLLSLICMDFLATNTFGKKGDLSARKHFLAKLEHHLGMKLIGVENGQVVYGLHTLKKLGED